MSPPASGAAAAAACSGPSAARRRIGPARSGCGGCALARLPGPGGLISRPRGTTRAWLRPVGGRRVRLRPQYTGSVPRRGGPPQSARPLAGPPAACWPSALADGRGGDPLSHRATAWGDQLRPASRSRSSIRRIRRGNSVGNSPVPTTISAIMAIRCSESCSATAPGASCALSVTRSMADRNAARTVCSGTGSPPAKATSARSPDDERPRLLAAQ